MSYSLLRRQKVKGKSQRKLFFENLEARSMLAVESTVFDFEELPPTSLPRNGAHTELVQTSGPLKMTITRPGSAFDIVDNIGEQEKPFPFRNRSIDPFYDETAKPFVVNFSTPVRSVELIFGDYGEDERDAFVIQAFSKRDGGGKMLTSNHKFLPVVEPNQWEWSVIRVQAEGITSLKMAGGTTSHPNSTFIDNIRVEYHTIGHDIGKTKTTLRTRLSMEVSHSLGSNVDKTGFEIRQVGANKSQWVQAAYVNGAAKTVQFQPKLAGHFEVRAKVRVGDALYRSEATPLDVLFPTAEQIKRSRSIRAAMDQAWEETKTFTKEDRNHRRMEIGFYVRYSSTTGKYTPARITSSKPVSGVLSRPRLELGEPPADKINNKTDVTNSPLASAIYTVAVFHTHTPMKYEWVGRPAGASDLDIETVTALRLVGLLYDYIGDSTGNVPGGWGLNKPAKLDKFGPYDRRPL